MTRAEKLKQQFDDADSTVWIVKYQDHMTTVIIYRTSWWRRALFALGINVYYKEELIKVMGDPFNIRDIKYPLTPDECIEPKSE